MAYSDVYNTLINVIADELPTSVYVYKFTFEGNACTMRDKLMPLIDVPIEGLHDIPKNNLIFEGKYCDLSR